MEGLQVEGGEDGRPDPASASQRSQAEVEGEARAVAAAFMLLLFPALINQMTVDVLMQVHPGRRTEKKTKGKTQDGSLTKND